MLHEILVTLKKRQGKLLNNNNTVKDTVKDTTKDTVNLIKKYPKITQGGGACKPTFYGNTYKAYGL